MDIYKTENHIYPLEYYWEMFEGSQQFVDCVLSDMQRLNSPRVKYTTADGTLFANRYAENIILFVDKRAKSVERYAVCLEFRKDIKKDSQWLKCHWLSCKVLI